MVHNDQTALGCTQITLVFGSTIIKVILSAWSAFDFFEKVFLYTHNRFKKKGSESGLALANVSEVPYY